MGGEFDLKFCNGGEFCMRVREEERVAGSFWRRKRRVPEI